MIALIGSEGSMGKRYQAILQYLDQKHLPLDRTLMSQDEILERASSCQKIIIASPTCTHLYYLRNLLPTKADILCEKPVHKNTDELVDLHDFCRRSGLSYKMVMQYQELLDPSADGSFSEYNYFRHGNDGLAWDCLQTLALSKGPVRLSQDSPVWYCMINGQRLQLSDMDQAYVNFIVKWLEGRLTQTLDDIELAHRRVEKYLQQERLQQGAPINEHY
jgi:hypothetical protein